MKKHPLLKLAAASAAAVLGAAIYYIDQLLQNIEPLLE